jgi:hypothetical protein
MRIFLMQGIFAARGMIVENVLIGGYSMDLLTDAERQHLVHFLL